MRTPNNGEHRPESSYSDVDQKKLEVARAIQGIRRLQAGESAESTEPVITVPVTSSHIGRVQAFFGNDHPWLFPSTVPEPTPIHGLGHASESVYEHRDADALGSPDSWAGQPNSQNDEGQRSG